MMAAWDVRPVSEILFLFFTGRGDSFLSPKRERKEWGRKRSPLEKQKENAVCFLFLQKETKRMGTQTIPFGTPKRNCPFLLPESKRVEIFFDL